MLSTFNMFNHCSLGMVPVLHLVDRIITCIIWRAIHNTLFLQMHLVKHALYYVPIVVSMVYLQSTDRSYLLFKILMLQMRLNLIPHWVINQDLLVVNSIISSTMQLIFAKLISLTLNQLLMLKVKLQHLFTIKLQMLVGFVIT